MELLYAIQCFSSSIFWFGQEHCGQGKFSQKDLYTQKAHSEVCKIPKFGVCRDTAIRTLQNLIKTSVWRSIYSTI